MSKGSTFSIFLPKSLASFTSTARKSCSYCTYSNSDASFLSWVRTWLFGDVCASHVSLGLLQKMIVKECFFLLQKKILFESVRDTLSEMLPFWAIHFHSLVSQNHMLFIQNHCALMLLSFFIRHFQGISPSCDALSAGSSSPLLNLLKFENFCNVMFDYISLCFR